MGNSSPEPISSYKWEIRRLNLLVQAINSSSPGAAYIRQWTGTALVQIMACRLFGAKPLSKPMLGLWSIRSSGTNFSEIWTNTNIFIHENAFENIVCEMAAILSRGRWVNFRSLPIDKITGTTRLHIFGISISRLSISPVKYLWGIGSYWDEYIRSNYECHKSLKLTL